MSGFEPCNTCGGNACACEACGGNRDFCKDHIPPPPSMWTPFNLGSPPAQLVWDGEILVRRLIRNPHSHSKQQYNYKVLDNASVERAVSKGWNEWMEIQR